MTDGFPDPVATPLPGGLMLVGPVGVALIGSALDLAARMSARDGIAIHASVSRLRAAVAEASAACGSAEVPQRPAREHSPTVGSVVGDRLGTAEAAELLGCGERNVRDLCSRGVFATAVRHRRSWVIARAEVLGRADLRGHVHLSISAA